MIYIDTSVAMASLLKEARKPPAEFWSQELVSSRLLEYEVMTRVNARSISKEAVASVRTFLSMFEWIEMRQEVLSRVLEPFPLEVRTLDALHLATAAHLIEQGQSVELATYDKRMAAAAIALAMPLYPL